jgi:hypothetical protein
MSDSLPSLARHPGMSFIQKPFTAENLAMQVRKVLDAV